MKIKLLKGAICTALLGLCASQAQAAALFDNGFDLNDGANTDLLSLTASNTPVLHRWLEETGAGEIVTAKDGVTALSGDRMLQVNAISLTASQVQQYIPFIASAGDTIQFSAWFNDTTGGASGSVALYTFDTPDVPTFSPGPDQLAASSLTIDGDANAWEKIVTSITLDSDIKYLGVQVAYNNASLDGGYAFVDDVTVSIVPVPAAAWLFGSGLIGLVGLARRKKA